MIIQRFVPVAFLALAHLLNMSAAEAKEVRPVRAGFTVELGVGVGAILVTGLNTFGDEKRDFGFEPHAIGLGWFVNDDLALTLRWKSTYHNTPNAVGESANRFLGTQTLNAQWWLSRRWFVGGGAGVAVFGFGFGSHRDDPAWIFGGAVDGRVGYAFSVFTHHMLLVSYEAVAGFFRSGAALGQTVNIGYQYY